MVRTFDAPEALETRFHEIHTKTALNRVPASSRVPFRWTINPYRGCAHACAYCLSGDTPVLMADGCTRSIASLRVGDEIYGTCVVGRYRRYTPTTVLAHWSSVKRAHRVTLADGTELVASGDHRFLTDRGWKHVTGTGRGPDRRPHLTISNSMLGTGAFASPVEHDEGYRRGYLCGLVRGDGHLATYRYARVGRAHGDVHRFRLALCDHEALQRAKEYLAELGVGTTEFEFQVATANRRPARAIRTSSKPGVDRVRELIRWPWRPTLEWSCGFLAGIFDAEGSFGDGVVRIANANGAILERTSSALTALGFDVALDGTTRQVRYVRIRGGLSAQLRFMHTVDPAITRKRTIDGRMIKTFAALGVAEIEDLGFEMPMYDITTGTGDFIANGVVSHNCFARPTHEYLDLDAGRDFEREIVVKVNVPEVLRAELARPRWGREHVALGTNTDPYQWVEGRYRLMRGIWAALRDAANPCSILTKSPLVLRDVDLLRELAAVTDVSACLSVPTLDEKVWRSVEPRAPNPRARLEAVAELNRQGIPTGILIAPLMPGINDAPEQVDAIVQGAHDAGAVSIGGNTLFLRGPVRRIFFDWLRAQRPDLVGRYERLYAHSAYLTPAVRDRVERDAAVPWRGESFTERFRRGNRGLPGDGPPTPVARPAPVQERLF